MCYIDYLSAAHDFKQKRVEFGSYQEALDWGRENLSNFLLDMVKFN